MGHQRRRCDVSAHDSDFGCCCDGLRRRPLSGAPPAMSDGDGLRWLLDTGPGRFTVGDDLHRSWARRRPSHRCCGVGGECLRRRRRLDGERGGTNDDGGLGVALMRKAPRRSSHGGGSRKRAARWKAPRRSSYGGGGVRPSGGTRRLATGRREK